MVTGAGFSEPYVFFTSGIPSLCIPPMGEEDGPLGVGDGLTGVTQLPASVSLAASFDKSLARQYGEVLGSEEHGKGAMVNLGPTVNIDRDPRWGRSFEAFTEDPFLNGAMAVSEIRGVQSEGEMSQVKHLAVYNQETNRNTPADNAIISQRARARDLPAGVLGRDQPGQGVVGDVRLQHDQRPVRVPEPGSDEGHARSALGVPGVRDLGLPGHALDRAVRGRRRRIRRCPRPSSTARRCRPPWIRARSAWPRSTRWCAGSRASCSGSTSSTIRPPAPRARSSRRQAHQAIETKVAEAGTVLLKNSGNTLPLQANGRRVRRRDRAGRLGVADRHRRWQRVRDRPVQRHAAAGHPGRGRTGHERQLHPGAADRHLADADPELRADARRTRRPAAAAATPGR